MTAALYGYARVSTRDQNLDRQFHALEEFGVRKSDIFYDMASGKDFDRPAWRQLLDVLKPEDVVAVKSIDRLGRNYQEILDEWRLVTREKQACIVVLDMPLLDTRVSRDGITNVLISDIVLQLLSYVAQVERENTRQRQAEGIAAARARGVQLGRPQIVRPKAFEAILEMFLEGSITRKQAAAHLGVSTTTFDRWRKLDLDDADT